MSDEVLALEWGRTEILGVEASVSGEGIRVLRCFRLSWPDGNSSSMDPPEAGRWLRGELDRLNVRAKQTRVVLPRDAIAVRYLQLPEARDEQLPDLVRFSAATKAQQPMEQLRVDYLPLPLGEDQSGRGVLLHTMQADRVDRLRQIAGRANLNLLSLGVTSVATAECVAHMQRRRHTWPAPGPTLIVVYQEPRLEIVVTQDQFVLFSHSKHLASSETGGSTAAQVLAEVRRALVAAGHCGGDLQVRRVMMFGEAAADTGLPRCLGEQLDCEVVLADPVDDLKIEMLEPAGGDQTPGEQLLGALLAHQGPLVASIDFLHPRQPQARHGTRKLHAGLIAAALLLLAVNYVVRGYGRIHRLEGQIADKQERVRQLQVSIDRNASVMDSADLLSEWESASRYQHWLDRMDSVSRQLPGTDTLYLTSLRFHQSRGDVVARVAADGLARHREDVESLYERLADTVDLRVRPKQIRQDSRRSEFPFRFELSLDVLPTEDETSTPQELSTSD